MNKLVKVLKKLAVEMILNDATKVKIVAKLNEKVNIPLISEEGLYEAMQEAISEAVNED